MVAALAFVLVLRALVPVGFMLTPSSLAPGWLSLTLCSSGTAQLITVPVREAAAQGHGHAHGDDHNPHHHDHPGHGTGSLDHALCGFAVASAGDLPPADGLTLPQRQIFVARREPVTRYGVMTPATAGPPVGSRAPPVGTQAS